MTILHGQAVRKQTPGPGDFAKECMEHIRWACLQPSSHFGIGAISAWPGLAWLGPAWPSMSRGRSMPDHEQPEPCLRSTCCAKYFARSWLKADCPVLLHMQKTGRSPLFISTNRLHLFPSQATLLRKIRTSSVWRRTPVLEKMERRWARAVLRRMLSASAASSSDRPLAS